MSPVDLPAPDRPRFFALRALALIAGFYVLAVGLSVALLGLAAVLVVNGRFRPTMLGAVLTAVVLLRAVVVVDRSSRLRDLPGIAAGPAEAEVVELVRRTAEQMGATPPTELRFVAEPMAWVGQDGRLLGLLPGRSVMVLGVSLLGTLHVDELRAVVAHELGHLHRRDLRLGGAVHRARAAMARAADALDGPIGRVFGAYESLFLRTTMRVARAQEEAADRAAVEIAGPTATAEALLRTGVAALAYDWYVDRYVSVLLEAGRWPADLISGFRRILDNPERAEELAGFRAELDAKTLDPYDSHPPLVERVAAALALVASERDPAPSVPAQTLLQDPEGLERAVAARLGESATGDPSAGIEWEHAADEVWVPSLRQDAEAVRAAAAWLLARERGVPSPPPTDDLEDEEAPAAPELARPEDVLELLDRGADEELARLLFGGFEELDGIEREAVAPKVLDAALFVVLADALVRDGGCRWKLSPSGPIELVDPAGFAIDVEALAAMARRGGSERQAVRESVAGSGAR